MLESGVVLPLPHPLGFCKMTLTIEDDALDAAGLRPEEARQILAAALYGWGRLSLGRAARVAEMSRIEFQRFLGRQRIPVGPTAEELDAEAETLKRLGLL